MRIGRNKPKTRNNQIAEPNAQKTCLPILCSMARMYVLAHQLITDTSRKKLAMMYQPPSCNGGKLSPYSGLGGSSASQNSCRMNSGIDQPTCASMFRPMMLKARIPVASDTIPVQPSQIGPS